MSGTVRPWNTIPLGNLPLTGGEYFIAAQDGTSGAPVYRYPGSAVSAIGGPYLPLVGGGILTNTTLIVPPAPLTNGAQFFPTTIPELVNAGQLYQNNVLYVDRTTSTDLDGPQIYSTYEVSHSDTGHSQSQILFNTRLEAFDTVPNSAFQVWNFLSDIRVDAYDPTGPGGSGGRVAIYGQAWRQAVPAGQVGISMEAAVLECRSFSKMPSSIDGPLRSLETDLFCDGVDDEPSRNRAAISVVLGQHTPTAHMECSRGVSITGDPGTIAVKRAFNVFTGFEESAFDCRQALGKPLSVDAIWTARAFTVNDRTTSTGNVYICTTSGTSTVAPTGTGTGINNGGTAVFNWVAVINAPWSNSTFTINQRCTAGSNLYVCTTPGSSTGAPTGTGTGINNGGVAVFSFVNVATANAFWMATGMTIALDSTPFATLSSDDTFIHASIAFQVGLSTNNKLTLSPGATTSSQASIGGGSPGILFPDTTAFSADSGGAWSFNNWGKQIQVYSVTTGTNNPAIAINDTNNTNLWGIGNVMGVLSFDAMPAYSDSTTHPTIAFSLYRNGDSIAGTTAAKAITDTGGYLYIPFVSGTPTGVPANATSGVAIVYDTSAHKFWAYDNGTNAWRGVALT